MFAPTTSSATGDLRSLHPATEHEHRTDCHGDEHPPKQVEPAGERPAQRGQGRQSMKLNATCGSDSAHRRSPRAARAPGAVGRHRHHEAQAPPVTVPSRCEPRAQRQQPGQHDGPAHRVGHGVVAGEERVDQHDHEAHRDLLQRRHGGSLRAGQDAGDHPGGAAGTQVQDDRPAAHEPDAEGQPERHRPWPGDVDRTASQARGANTASTTAPAQAR